MSTSKRALFAVVLLLWGAMFLGLARAASKVGQRQQAAAVCETDTECTEANGTGSAY